MSLQLNSYVEIDDTKPIEEGWYLMLGSKTSKLYEVYFNEKDFYFNNELDPMAKPPTGDHMMKISNWRDCKIYKYETKDN
tara:strand:- start:55878 stop:56117 length:240 start_codon:yes stop_codon:yes gene_type:complete